MHEAAYLWVKHCLSIVPPRKRVLEYGGKNINGSIRDLFSAPIYLSIDLASGPGVDLVADASSYNPEFLPDTVVCCEVLEHTHRWYEIVRAAGRVLDPESGILILTCATHGRLPHSAVDGGPLWVEEYYRNIDPLQFTNVLDSAGFEQWEVDLIEGQGDLRAIAYKKARD